MVVDSRQQLIDPRVLHRHFFFFSKLECNALFSTVTILPSSSSFFELFAKNLKLNEQKLHTSHNDEISKKNNINSHSSFFFSTCLNWLRRRSCQEREENVCLTCSITIERTKRIHSMNRKIG